MQSSASPLVEEASAASATREISKSLTSNLAVREAYRDEYWRKHDPIIEDRLLWRAQTFRHTVHLLPGQSILELGCGEMRQTRALLRVSRNENPITAATFRVLPAVPSGVPPDIELVDLQDFPGPLAGRGRRLRRGRQPRRP